jgi:pyrimidine operon attenuation protein/uracil phosphoribosyltransferase
MQVSKVPNSQLSSRKNSLWTPPHHLIRGGEVNYEDTTVVYYLDVVNDGKTLGYFQDTTVDDEDTTVVYYLDVVNDGKTMRNNLDVISNISPPFSHERN